MPQLIADQVRRTPQAVALERGDVTMSYGELDRRAREIAAHLRALGVGREDLVAISMSRSFDLVATMLAVWHAGAALLPVDPDYPEEHRAWLFEDAAPRALVTESALVAAARAHHHGPTLVVDALPGDVEPWADDAPGDPHELAYVIYTSGSTGRPKGVAIEHHGFVNLMGDVVDSFALDPSSRVLQFASISFDACIVEVMMTLVSGATLCLATRDELLPGAELADLLRERRITTALLTPSVLGVLSPDDLADLEVIVSVGESCSRELFERWGPGRRFVNGYGPTETTAAASHYVVEALPAGAVTVPIGGPLTNAELYVLDEALRQVPIGTPGEICIGGVCVGRGYLGREDLTAERFVASPFGPPGARLYRTGDRGRWLPDATIEFLGRFDDQAKVRGHRVEPGEIAAALRRQPGVGDAAVIAREEPAGSGTKLVAYVAPRHERRLELWPSVAEHFIYDDVLYYAMTSDTRRNEAYRVAIAAAVKDKVVLDIGTGPDAILSRICVAEGARKVYAVDLLPETVRKATEKVAELGLSDRISVSQGDAQTLSLPELADVSVSELVGALGGSEGAANLINDTRRLLRPDAKIVPERSVTHLAAVSLSDELLQAPAFSRATAVYVDKIFEQVGHAFDLRVCLRGLLPRDLASDVGVLEDLDFTRECPLDYRHDLALTITRPTRLHGLLAWLHLYTGGGAELDILEHEHCWLPVWLPVFEHGVDVQAGDRIEGEVGAQYADGLHPTYRVKGRVVRAAGDTVEFDHTAWHAEPVFRATAFYDRLFADDRPAIAPTAGDLVVHDLRRQLAAELPDWMVPSAIVVLPSLPLTPNGKVDRGALPAPTRSQLAAGAPMVLPRNQLETEIVAIWSEVLGLEEIGIHDDFFDLGGDSLRAAQVAVRLRRAFTIALPLNHLFEVPTVAGLSHWLRTEAGVDTAGAEGLRARIEAMEPARRAELVELLRRRRGDEAGGVIPRRAPGDPAPLSFSQQRLWFLEQLHPGSHVYSAILGMDLRGPVDADALERALQRVVDRHQPLRTTFRLDDDCLPYLHMLEDARVELVRDDVSTLPLARRRRGAVLLQRRQLRRPFDLANDVMIRGFLIRRGPDDHVLTLVAHHIACDGWSKAILYDELAAFYEEQRGGAPADLPELPIDYADFALWQRRGLERTAQDPKVEFWTRTLAGAPVKLEIPTDFERPALASFDGAYHFFDVPAQLSQEMRDLGRTERATLYMAMLAAFNVLLCAESGQTDIVIGTPIANRVAVEVEHLIGFFANTLVLRNDLSGTPTFRDLLRRTRDSALAAYAHQDLPFEKIVEALRPVRDPSRNPIFQVNFRVGARSADLTLDGVEIRSHPIDPGISRFDMAVDLVDTPNGLSGRLEYATALFTPATAQRLATTYVAIAHAVVAEPDRPVHRLPAVRALIERQLAQATP